MKKIWLYSVRSYVSIGMFFYFKRIDVFGFENIPKDKPVLFLGNHQNALLDPLLIAIKCGRFSFFLTRAGVFKKPLVIQDKDSVILSSPKHNKRKMNQLHSLTTFILERNMQHLA